MHKPHKTLLFQSDWTACLREDTTVKNTFPPFILKAVPSLSLTRKENKVRSVTNAIPGHLADLQEDYIPA